LGQALGRNWAKQVSIQTSVPVQVGLFSSLKDGGDILPPVINLSGVTDG
jgi:hypothetical protein